MSESLATTSGTLRDAQSAIAKLGFSSGQNNSGGFLSGDWRAIGVHDALMRSLGSRRAEAIACLAAVIGRTDEGSIGIETWANAYGRTKEQVLSAFDRAIAVAEATDR